MDIRQRKTLNRFSRALVFVERGHPVLEGASSGFGKQVQQLRDAVTAIDRVASDRGSGAQRKAARQRAVLKRALRVNQLLPILRVARVVARTIGGAQHLVNIPVRTANTQALLDTAKAVLRDVAPYEAQFIDKGLSDTFLQRLGTTVQALEAANRAHIQARLASAAARGELLRALRDGRDTLMLLDSAIREMCDADPTLGEGALSAWNTIVIPRGRAKQHANAVVSGTLGDVTGSDL